MARKSNALVAMQTATVNEIKEGPDLAPRMQAVVREIEGFFGEAHAASLTSFWNIGKLIRQVADDPDSYLTAEQKSAHTDASALLISVFAPIYTADQMRSAETFFERYPGERQLERLLEMRCPDAPKWRLTMSHVQLLSQIPDDDKRAALEEKCAEEALPAKTLAVELQEVRGKKSNGGRNHQAPKGLKNQLHDLLQHVRRFVGRSESLWLGDENIYDDYVNASPTKRDGVAQQHWDEIGELLIKLSDVVGNHIGMFNKACEALEPNDNDNEEEEEDADMAADARRAAAAAAAAAARRKGNITR
jgi:hypothetical protein